MKPEDLEKVLKAHAKWIAGEPEGERANLVRADLYGVLPVGDRFEGHLAILRRAAGTNPDRHPVHPQVVGDRERNEDRLVLLERRLELRIQGDGGHRRIHLHQLRLQLPPHGLESDHVGALRGLRVEGGQAGLGIAGLCGRPGLSQHRLELLIREQTGDDDSHDGPPGETATVKAGGDRQPRRIR